MKRQLASAVITAAVITGTVAAIFSAAAPASAAGRASIRSYDDTVSIAVTGLGRDGKFRDRGLRSQQVVLSPSIAYYRLVKHSSNSDGKRAAFKGLYYLVGGKDYAEVNGAKVWTVTPATPAELRRDALTLNPASGLAKFRRIPGVALIAPREYQVSGTPAQVGAFLAFEYGISARSLTRAGITSVRITLLTDSAGRPLTYTVFAKSALEKIVVTEKFAGYNHRLTITAPA